MSFVDTVGPFVLYVLLGLSVFIAAIALAVGWTAKQVKQAHELIEYRRRASTLIDDLIYELHTSPSLQLYIPQPLQDDMYALKGASSKEINR